jgi:pimeloyl-ACP methyl ester carboxylesterase
MGARIGLELVIDERARVRRAVLGGVGTAGAIDSSDAIADALLRGEPTDDPVAQTFYKFASARPTNDLRALAACIRGLRPNADPARLSAIGTPILVVVGDKDDIARGAPELIAFLTAE